ncbi:hypothetical protein LSAT2_002655 [Lamellibrachia satsuma]|nr:hypothetical protein LSAT2_002655 [Lamellibrachia satsuma]
MDNSVVNILSHDPSTSTLYGLAANGRAVVASVDGGSEWASVPYRTSITGPGVNLATDIPWMKNDRIMPGGTTPHMSNTHDNWGANYDGMFHLATGTWNKVADWTSCCYNTSEYN